MPGQRVYHQLAVATEGRWIRLAQRGVCNRRRYRYCVHRRQAQLQLLAAKEDLRCQLAETQRRGGSNDGNNLADACERDGRNGNTGIMIAQVLAEMGVLWMGVMGEVLMVALIMM